MKPSPPKVLRTQKPISRPFYEFHTKSSAQIVAEARSTIRSLDTKRPYTPLDSLPRLLVSDNKLDFSSFSIDSRPSTGKKLSPIKDGKEQQQYYVIPRNKVVKIGKSIKSGDTHGLLPSLKIQPSLTQSSCLSEPIIKVSSYSTAKETEDYVKTWLNKCNNSEDKNKVVHTKYDRKRFEENITPLLKQMELNHLHEDYGSLLINFDILLKTLQFEDMLGKNKLEPKQRSEVLSTALKCSEEKNPLVLLKLSKLFIALEVTGKNLEIVSKILFHLAQEKENDLLFVKEKMFDPILQVLKMIDKSERIKCLIFLCGTLKLLSENCKIVPELVQCNVLNVLVNVLEVIEKFYKAKNQTTDCPHAVLQTYVLQVVSTFANLANEDSLHEEFVSCKIPDVLFSTIDIYNEDEGIVLSYCRVISKLTVNEKWCVHLHNESFYKNQVQLLRKHHLNKDIAVRIFFVIGNLASYLIECRNIFTFQTECLDLVVSVVNLYVEKCRFDIKPLTKVEESKLQLTKVVSKDEDVIIKAVRVIANLSMSKECAEAFCNEKKYIDTFIIILGNQNVSFELRNNVIATINNLAYFATDECYFSTTRVSITEAIIKLLFSVEVKSEVLRALGNLTQNEDVRETLIKNNFGENVSELLDSSNQELLFSVCGLLVNMVVDKRFILKQQNVIPKLIDLLRNLSENDWCLAALICQIFCNYTDELTNIEFFFNQEESDDIVTILNEFIDPVLALDYEKSEIDEDTINWLKQSWYEDFFPVACKLLQRFNNVPFNDKIN
ncbi:armadillo repeat-containing protein 2 isoform X1 [Hydra vulgaris]|uniref:armadillo repeat-containing protein 2 isoform X1 n=1 Tax=Hydra vulgaris TaxID=6087 RepID=UPI001F5E93A6|nr:armadillo repeat-containing protein 2 isoform X1 [Hydra vulgaris]XP_047128990.1 armadillo repeat-containing protein 2 isoform X1 [Hydra vulgaris]